MKKLLYIGKSNKRFTHDKLYNYIGYHSDYAFHIIIFSNQGNRVTLDENYIRYFELNFKFVNEKEINKIDRKKKLKKLGKE
jgi:hypothetical protein